MKDKISKFISVLKRDGLIKTLKKTHIYFMANYFNKINIIKKIDYKINHKKYEIMIDKILANDKYDRILMWRGSFGWNVPLFQRPQHIARRLTDNNTLMFYEVTRMTDKIKFIKKEKEDLYLVNYEIKQFENMLIDKIKQLNINKYLHLYSTCWDVSDEILKKYVSNDFDVLYEYIDDLNPQLAGTNKLPDNVKYIHKYISSHVEDSIVVVSADKLYSDIINKRNSKKNVVFATNGVDYEFFNDCHKEQNINKELIEIKNRYKKIIGYYGALAIWFDYDLVKQIAKSFPDYAIVLFGIKYDTSYDLSEIDKIDNIYFLGSIDYNDLPFNANYFDICTIPFIINDITLSTNPLKVFEYMAMHKPIITTAMPECQKYKSVNIANNSEEFIQLIRNIDKINTPKYQAILDKEARENSWDEKTIDIIKGLEKFEKGKREKK